MNAQKRNNSSHRVMNRIIVLIGVLIIGAFIFTFFNASFYNTPIGKVTHVEKVTLKRLLMSNIIQILNTNSI